MMTEKNKIGSISDPILNARVKIKTDRPELGQIPMSHKECCTGSSGIVNVAARLESKLKSHNLDQWVWYMFGHR